LIIFGTRQRGEVAGYAPGHCVRCGQTIIGVIQRTKKFTLYFIPVFTCGKDSTATCLRCGMDSSLPQGSRLYPTTYAAIAALPPEPGLTSETLPSINGSTPRSAKAPGDALAVATIAMAVGTVMADRVVEDDETAAMAQAIETIASSTRSEVVRRTARISVDRFSELFDYVGSPHTPPIRLMLATAGTEVRKLPKADQLRFVGQLAWLCHTIARASSSGTASSLSAMDQGFVAMGFGANEVAAALTYCEANGG
jgi:hypothetical protein